MPKDVSLIIILEIRNALEDFEKYIEVAKEQKKALNSKALIKEIRQKIKKLKNEIY